jgi:DNA-binding SARP family transcriptional activator
MERYRGRVAHGRTGRIKVRKPVTLDERIEALTQSVELLASMHKDTETRFAQLATAAERNEQRTGQLMETMNRVGRILEIHDSQV